MGPFKRGTLIGCVMLIAGISVPCSAGTIYKCVSEDGLWSYGQTRRPQATCTVFDRYADTKPAKPPPAHTPPRPKSASAPASVSADPPKSGSQRHRPRVRSMGKFYAYIQDGVRHYTSRPPDVTPTIVDLRTVHYDVIETCYACGKAPSVDFHAIALNTHAYEAEIAHAAQHYGVEQALIRAIMHAESAYNPRALSRAGAQGLMQLMPATAQRFGASNGFDVEANIEAGARYLAWLLGHFHGDITLVSAGYNAGEAAVDHYHGVPPYDETQRYVARVTILLERYRHALSAAYQR